MDIDNNNNNEAKDTVYISFDDNDSSMSSFINYLRATFKRHGIYELDDKNNRLTEQIRVLVVVLSSNYKFFIPANLVNHLSKKDLVVVPVLHGVTVSSVKQQIAVLEPSSSVNQVPMWPRVLLESDVLQGHVYNDEQSESKFMEEIAKDVFEKLYPTEEIGIHERLLKIENLLCKQPWGLRSVGICGEHSIGKTTLARAVFRRMSGGYDASCFIKDFHKEYSEKRLGPLSDEYLGETPIIEYNQNRSVSKLSRRRKRVLIALDDVQNARDAELFLGGGFGPGSLIIITSRDEQVLKDWYVNEIYELQGLNQEDALKLFTRCAFGKEVTDKNILELAMKEIECANGNPSTIRAHATMMREMEPVLLNIRGVRSSGQGSSCCVVENNTSVSIVSNEGEVNIELPSPHNVDLVCLMREFINSSCEFIMLVKSRISTYKSYLMCIVVSWVFGLLWNFLGDWEDLGFRAEALIYLVLVYGYLCVLRYL